MSESAFELPHAEPGREPEIAVVAALVRSVVERRNAPMLGTEIAVLLKATFPDFHYGTYGAGSLSHLLTQHVPDLVVVGRQGGDVLYTIESKAPAHRRASTRPVAAAQEPTAEASVWRAFSSPNSARVVATQVHRDNGSWRVVPPETQDTPEWLTVAPLSADEHRAIAQEFLTSALEHEVSESLSNAFEAGDGWWLEFRRALERYPDDDARYRVFRADRLLRALRQRLETLNLHEAARDAAIRLAAPSLSAARDVGAASESSRASSRPSGRRISSERSAAAATSLSAAGDAAGSNDQFRTVALAILSALPTSELREIRVRLGDVLDFLHQQRGR